MLFMALAVIGSGEDSTDWTSCADPWRCYIKNAGKSGQGPPVRPLLVLFCTTTIVPWLSADSPWAGIDGARVGAGTCL